MNVQKKVSFALISLPQITTLLIWLLGINIPLQEQTPSPINTTGLYPSFLGSQFPPSKALHSTIWIERVTALILAILGILGSLKLLEIKDQTIKILEIENNNLKENQNGTISEQKAHIDRLKTENELLKNSPGNLDLAVTNTNNTLENILEWMHEQIEKKEKQINQLQLQEKKDKLTLKQLIDEKASLQDKIALLEQPLLELKTIEKRLNIYQELKNWLSNNINYLSKEAGEYALAQYPDLNVFEEDTNSSNKNEVFVKSILKYLKWIFASLEAGEPILLDRKRLSPIINTVVYTRAFSFIQGKASECLSNEATAELSQFFDYLNAHL